MKVNPFGFNRITAYNQQVNKSNNVQKAQKAEDTVEISASAKYKQVASSFSLERQEKVQALKKQIEEGTYQINYAEVAKSMIQFYKK